ncbi:MAG: prephenate dehydrogenase/arogenate dehydrogenase family protein [Chloroflexota bacterium]
MKRNVSIIGLGKRGSSIGLALSQKDHYHVVGNDIDSAMAKEASRRGAVHQTQWNLKKLVEDADIIALALPLNQVQETLSLISPVLPQDCVVIDTTVIKEVGRQWAEDHLTAGANYVGVFLSINPQYAQDMTQGVAGARADMFLDGNCCVVPAAACSTGAISKAIRLVEDLGSTSYFMDPVEFDGLSTAVNTVPALLVSAFIERVSSSPSWREMRRLSTDHLLHFSHPLALTPDAVALAAVEKRETVQYWIQQMMEELDSLSHSLQNEDVEGIASMVNSATDTRSLWLADWKLNLWEQTAEAELPKREGWLSRMLGVKWPRAR